MSINVDNDLTQCDGCRVETGDTIGWTEDDYGGNYCPKCTENMVRETSNEVTEQEAMRFFDALKAESVKIQEVWIKGRKPSIGFDQEYGTLYATPYCFDGEPVTVVFTWSSNDNPVTELPSPENECGRIRLDVEKRDFIDPLNEEMEDNRQVMLEQLLSHLNAL
jgi:hypothetical protein